jgi:tetratricopeptide (TPR) repeat protein
MTTGLDRRIIVIGWMAAISAFCQTPPRVATLERAAKLIGAHDPSGAEDALQLLLDKSPDDPLALNLLGLVRMEQKQPEQAEALFRRAIEKGPHLAGPHVNLAMLYGAARAEDAIKELSEALKLAPDHDQARAMLRDVAQSAASECARAGEKEKALAVMMAAHRAMPRDPDLLLETALAAMEDKLFADAEKYLLKAIAIRPDFPAATYALARAYLEQDKMILAEQEMRKYLAARPDDATAHYGLGYILVAEQKLDEARAAFEKSLALQARQTESVFQLGEIALEQGQSDQAGQYFKKVLDQDPKHAGALTETGLLALRSGSLDEAHALLERAVALAPSYQKAHYYYALTLKRLGKKDEATREFRISTDLQKHDVPSARIAPDRP